MGSPEEEAGESLEGKGNSFKPPLKNGGPGPGGGESRGKASPQQVIGKRRPMGRLNKRLILGIVAALGVGMLILNFLPSGKNAKQSTSSENSVYANDTMPQDIQEMALRVPAPSPSSATSSGASANQGSSKVGSPFAGYPGAAGDGTSPVRSTSAVSANTAERDYQGMAATDAKLEAEAAARRAPMEVATKLTAGLTVGASGESDVAAQPGTSGSLSTAAGATAATRSTQGAQFLAGTIGPQASYTPGQIYRDFNDQLSKASFSQQQAEAAAPNVGRSADPALLPYTIFAGTIIPAALETAINTDLPGDLLATVTENVFDSVSGKNLLIPQGSKLLAQYSSNVSFGQSRVQVAWQRLIRPDGLSLVLSNMNGVDPQGMSGYQGYVDQHLWEYAKGIGLMALFSIINGQLQYSMKTANNPGVSDIANSVTSGIDQVGTQYTSNAMNIQPTITVKQGAKIQVFVNSDIIMPAANQRKVAEKYSIPKQEGGRK
jgi:type IV secretory pathway VirB10-like protein